MAHSLVMAGEICPVRQDGVRSERDLRRPRSCATRTIRGEKISFERVLTISGVDRFTRRGGTCRLHAIFMNQLCILWGYQKELSSTAGHGEKNSTREYVVRSPSGRMSLPLKRRLTLDAIARVTRIGRAEPQARRVSH